MFSNVHVVCKLRPPDTRIPFEPTTKIQSAAISWLKFNEKYTPKGKTVEKGAQEKQVLVSRAKKSSQIRKRVNSRKKTSDVVEQVSGSSSSSDVSIDDEYDSGEWPSDDNSEDKHNMLKLRALERKRQRLEDEKKIFGLYLFCS